MPKISPPKALFIASTGQHVGKTTTCLGLMSGLRKRFGRVGYMKPIGQESIEVEQGMSVDKDVALVHDHFHMSASLEHMSPVLLPAGFTKQFLDGTVNGKDLRARITTGFQQISAEHTFTVIEGTGHVGVGSIINLNNAQVAALLQVPMILVAHGGLGSSFDELEANRTLCEKYGVPVIGIILNRVIASKRDMLLQYMPKCLSRWNIPLIGAIPFDPLLSDPSMKDFAGLFQTELMSGQRHLLRHFKQTRLAATSVDAYRPLIDRHQLVITPANREDILLAIITKHWDIKLANPADDLGAGCILTGDEPPSSKIIDLLRQADIPMLYAPISSFNVMQMMSSFVAKIRKEDTSKIQEAIEIVEQHIDFSFFETPFLF